MSQRPLSALPALIAPSVADGSRRCESAHSNALVANLSKREIPSLHGLRGIAALMVVFYHYFDHWQFHTLFPGPHAVTLFFELSGLLITWLLLKEIDVCGHLDRKQFYLRRILRLFPVFYAVWILCRLAGPFPGMWATFFYLGDYYHALRQHYNVLTVAWSLGVEEKFYLLWPLVLARVERSRLIRILTGILIAEPVYRFVLISCGYRAYTWFAFDTRLDAIVVGCLIALACKSGWRAPEWLSHPFTPVAALLLVFVLQDQGDAVTWLLAVILVSVICRPVAILNNPAARYLGEISYSLYLCHGYAREVVWPRILAGFHWQHPAVILLTQFATAIALASALHFMVERPFLRLKNRFHGKRPAQPAPA